MEQQGLNRRHFKSLPIDFYLQYTQWFQEQKNIQPLLSKVTRLNVNESAEYRYCAQLENDEQRYAKHVVLALGLLKLI